MQLQKLKQRCNAAWLLAGTCKTANPGAAWILVGSSWIPNRGDREGSHLFTLQMLSYFLKLTLLFSRNKWCILLWWAVWVLLTKLASTASVLVTKYFNFNSSVNINPGLSLQTLRWSFVLFFFLGHLPLKWNFYSLFMIVLEEAAVAPVMTFPCALLVMGTCLKSQIWACWMLFRMSFTSKLLE